ncbi:cytochrome c-type biogenesis protein [Carboxydothermus pertinax]|uniref:Cytochrome c-type biogenesis protein n=1 Tax=Carboxydothermus pertinax TaxID=870242 RepID=A0A1L8CU20_9THEO|nr:cytochrome c-type biogenesis protein CcmH [Carboxydothermus pertinax]GAV22418.1 cytochrome c-type biogenesis protein CcmH [Carboxydothermus pertinax]
MPAKKLFILITLIMLLVAGLSPTFGEVDKDVLNNVIHTFWAPDFCGMNLADCPASSAEEMRNQIKQMLEQGKTKQEIIKFYTDIYGTKILAEPPKSGFFATVWIIPAVAVIAGGILALTVVKNRRKIENIEEEKNIKVDEKIATEVEKELKKYL